MISMGRYPSAYVDRMKAKDIKWFATATTVAEAVAAQDAGADAIVAQGMEAGRHRGAFDATKAETCMVGLFSLLPAVIDAVNVPVIATLASRMCAALQQRSSSALLLSRSARAFFAVRKRKCLQPGPTPSAGLCRKKHWSRAPSPVARVAVSLPPMLARHPRQTHPRLLRILSSVAWRKPCGMPP